MAKHKKKEEKPNNKDLFYLLNQLDKMQLIELYQTNYVKYLRGDLAGREEAELRASNRPDKEAIKRLLSFGRDLRNLNMDSLDLSGFDLRYVDFRNSVMTKVNLDGARLDRARFNGAVLFGAKLTHLQPATVYGLKITQVGESFRAYTGNTLSQVYADQEALNLNTIMSDFDKVELAAISQFCLAALDIPGADDEAVPLWLKYDVPPQARDVSTAISTLNMFTALLRVSSRELSSIPAYASAIDGESPWDEKQNQEQAERLAKLFMEPTNALEMHEQLYLYRVLEGSINLGLGRVPKWLLKKLSQMLEIIPKWKLAKSEADKHYAEAEKIRAEAEGIREENKTVGPKSEAETAAKWEEVYTARERRVQEAFTRRLEAIRKVQELLPSEYRKLPPEAVMALLNQLISIGEEATSMNGFGKILGEDEIDKLPPIIADSDEEQLT
jgi:hypothetical protein